MKILDMLVTKKKIGYDFVVKYKEEGQERLVEAKGTDEKLTKKKKWSNFCFITDNEYNVMRKNKNYWIYLINNKTGEIVKQIPRKDILKLKPQEKKYWEITLTKYLKNE